MTKLRDFIKILGYQDSQTRKLKKEKNIILSDNLTLCMNKNKAISLAARKEKKKKKKMHYY